MPTCDTVSTYHIIDNARYPQRGLSRATYLLKVSRWAAEPNVEEETVLSDECYAAHRARYVLAEGDLHPSHGHGSMTAQVKGGTAALHEDVAPAASTPAIVGPA